MMYLVLLLPGIAVGVYLMITIAWYVGTGVIPLTLGVVWFALGSFAAENGVTVQPVNYPL